MSKELFRQSLPSSLRNVPDNFLMALASFVRGNFNPASRKDNIIRVLRGILNFIELDHNNPDETLCTVCSLKKRLAFVPMIPLLEGELEEAKQIGPWPGPRDAWAVLDPIAQTPNQVLTEGGKCSDSSCPTYHLSVLQFMKYNLDYVDEEHPSKEEFEKRKAEKAPATTNTGRIPNTPTATPVAQSEKAANMSTKKTTKFKDVGVINQGEQIILPEGMDFDEGVQWLLRRKEEAERTVMVSEIVGAHPLEGAYALQQVLEEKFGFTAMVAVPGFFGLTPPQMFTMEIALGHTVQVPWGRIEMPLLEGGYIQCGIDQREEDIVFAITAKVKQKQKSLVSEIAELVRQKVKAESIYRGKAIYLTFPDKDEDGNPNFNINNTPKFMDALKFNEDSLIFSEETMGIIQSTILTPIEKTQLCRDLKIPLKRGILLEGPYGVGKTLTAGLTAKKSVENGWTFLYLQNPEDLARAIRFASKYQPAAIFLEDVDRALEGSRDDAMNEILNTMDGIDTKATEVIVILTTNHVEKLNKAALRPGRLDAVISIRAPDASAVEKLIYTYASSKIGEDEDLSKVSAKLAEANTIPAVIREVVERAKLGSLSHVNTTEEVHITANDLMVATASMLQHLKLLAESPTDNRHAMEKLGDSFGLHFVDAVSKFVVQNGGRFPEPDKTNGKKVTASTKAA